MTRCIHITPELPPTVGGVADYTALLSRRLVEVSDGAVNPVLVHAGKEPAEAIEVDTPVVDLSGQCSAAALTETVRRLSREADERAVVLLEYSGYGYSGRGTPVWLYRGLERSCRTDSVELVTVFHELAASGPPWSSAFWLAPLQRWIAKCLLRASSHVLVNRPPSADQLRSWASDASKVVLQPVFSNVGEPEANPPLDDRDCAVIFCGGREKELIYDRSDQLEQLLRREGIERLVDIGPPPETFPSMDVPCDVLGVQPAEAVSRWLLRARMGFARRRLDLLTKSGVVAAYLAHGVPPVILPHGTPSHSPFLSEGDHYVTFRRACSSEVDWKRLGQQAYDWYQNQAHSFEATDAVLRAIARSEKLTNTN
jgi:hypothetical protein